MNSTYQLLEEQSQSKPILLDDGFVALQWLKQEALLQNSKLPILMNEMVHGALFFELGEKPLFVEYFELGMSTSATTI